MLNEREAIAVNGLLEFARETVANDRYTVLSFDHLYPNVAEVAIAMLEEYDNATK